MGISGLGAPCSPHSNPTLSNDYWDVRHPTVLEHSLQLRSRLLLGQHCTEPVPTPYTHLVEGESLDHDSFLWILPDGQRALGFQQVMDLLVVHLEQGTHGCYTPALRSSVHEGHTIRPDESLPTQYPAGHCPGMTQSS